MRTLYTILKQPFFGRFQKPWRWPQEIAQHSWERVTFRSRNGAQLAGLFGAATSAAVNGTVALAHPLTTAAKGFWLKQGHADLLRRNGLHVLAFDFNGFGESEASDLDFPADIIAAGDYLRERHPDLPVAGLGASFGAGWTLCALARDGHPFQAAVLEAAFPTLPDYWRRYRVPYAVLRVSQILYPALERELRPLRAAAQVSGQPDVLLIYGEQDTITPPQVGEQLRAAMQTRAAVELWQVPEAEHTFALRAAPDAYAQRVTGFLQRSFVKSTPAERISMRNDQP